MCIRDRCSDEVAQNGGALDDVDMILPVREGERVVGEFHEIGFAAHRLQLAHRFEVVGERDVVNGNVAHVQVDHRLIDALVGLSLIHI